MAAQQGSTVLLGYGPQGVQQSGASSVLNYTTGYGWGASKTLRTTAAARWNPSAEKLAPIFSPSPATDTLKDSIDNKWASAEPVSAVRSPRWPLAAYLDTEADAPHKNVGIKMGGDRVVPWGKMGRCDDERVNRYGAYGDMLNEDRGSVWFSGVPADAIKPGPWLGFLIPLWRIEDWPRPLGTAANFVVVGGKLLEFGGPTQLANQYLPIVAEFGPETYTPTWTGDPYRSFFRPDRFSVNFNVGITGRRIPFLDANGNRVWGSSAIDKFFGVQHPRTTGLDDTTIIPWIKYSRPMSPGWGIVVPSEPTDPQDNTAQIVIPLQRAYIVINQTTLARADDGTQIPAENLAVNFDCDSWLPAFSATIQADAIDAVMPSPGPVEVIATINTVPFRFFVEKIQRNRAFGKRTVSISGRGVACELDAPYALTSRYLFAGDRTAQQMIDDALQYTGYSQTWGITDWLIPGGTFSVSGAPITVAQAVAEASGSVLAAHWSSRNLRMLPRYKAKPWEWDTTTPDIILPAEVIQTEGVEWSEKPDYNAVFVSGTTNGVVGHVKRTGTAGDVVAPMVTHPLITHADAARQRGTAILSNTGRKTSLQLSLPVLPETGVIDVCKLIQFNDGTTSRRGIVRANSIAVNFPTVRQTLTIEAQA